jgi:SAM-dependent methyltransferase
MSVNRALRTSFDQVAGLYDETRPGYPEPLIEDVVSLAAIPPGGRILEIGCGSGQATLPFARRGYAMLCLELGPNLAALAASHCRPYPQVEIQNLAFEDWPLQRERFDLVISASAFDWIAPEIGYPKAAAALRDGGSLALFWHDHVGADTPFFRAARELRRELPELAETVKARPPGSRLSAIEGEIQASALFGPATTRRYPWTAEYTADRYVNLLQTYSAVRNLAPGTRREFLARIQALAEQHGGTVHTRTLSFLVLAQVQR